MTLPYYMTQQTRDMLIAESKRLLAERARKRSSSANHEKHDSREDSDRETRTPS